MQLMRCEIYLLSSLFVYCSKKLDIHDYVEKGVDYGLEIEKVSVAAESVDPSNPHEESVLY